MAIRPTDVLTDSRGRKISVTTLSVTDQYRLRSAIRPSLRSDDTAQSLAQAAACVKDIDGVPVLFPETPQQLEATMDKLDDEGWTAVLSHMQAKMEAATKALKDIGGPLDQSKQSPAPPA